METNGTNARVLSGRGVVHRHWTKRQLACLAANVAEGQTRVDWSIAQLSAALRVGRGYIDLARSFSPEKRQAIIAGLDHTSFATLLKAPESQLALPAPKRRVVINGKSIDDVTLMAVVRSAGVERTLQAAMAVEAAQ